MTDRDTPTDGATCVSCGHPARAHATTGASTGTCASPGCGCTHFWDRPGFDDVLDLGERPRPRETLAGDDS